MRTYLLRRVLQGVPTLLLLTLIAFLFISLAPGDAATAMIDPTLGADALEARRAELGLDQPLPIRYLKWLAEVFRGNLGYSLIMRRPVSVMIGERLGPTLLLGGVSILLASAIGIAAGVISGLRQYSWLDYTISLLSYAAWSLPNFFLGLMLIYIFAIQFKILPSAGMFTPGADSFGNRLRHMILPVTVLAVQFIGIYARQTRSAVLDVLREDYVMTARAKGLREYRVALRHMLPNALIPVITVIGLSLPLVVTGAILTEIVFSWSGMGSLTVNAITARDYPVVMGIVLIIGICVLIANLLVDVAYAVVDPRIRYQ